MIHTAIDLFAILFPLQSAEYQEEYLAKTKIVINQSAVTKLLIDKSISVKKNIFAALDGCLKVCMLNQGTLKTSKIEESFRILAEDGLSSNNLHIKSLSADMIGRLCLVVSQPTFVNSVIQNQIDQIVQVREPEPRAGRCITLGSIVQFMGGISIVPHLKNIVGLFLALILDSNPLVHTWALYSLIQTIESTGSNYAVYIDQTISVIFKILSSEIHNPLCMKSNPRTSHFISIMARLVFALIDALGPDLQSSASLRMMFFNLYAYFRQIDDYLTSVQSIRIVQHLFLFSPQHVSIDQLVPFLQSQIENEHVGESLEVKKAAITCLYSLTQKYPLLVIRASKTKIEEQLLRILDNELNPLVAEGIRDILMALLKHESIQIPSK